MFNTNKVTTERSSASSGSSSSPISAGFSSPTTPAGPLSSFTTPSTLASPIPSLVPSASTSASTSGGPSSRSGASTVPSYVTPTSGPGSLVGMAIRAFPRTNWDGVIFDGDSTDPRDQTEWAGREASKRWAAALEAGNLGDLDTVDFGVAVFDHVCEP
ncbi:hypothetical protein CcaverHIS002_0206990 [Cutaneotrichosporon cavernicola]|uniref:Uncharacterized protein n=1 Tax=Cutaneotrichosporon cavernicola TaxID=279322 RepID=A0AA48I1E0_9TREE|nr:uncharacterized protein CcaverHIS019_0206980 [Cutaneotrichosporon cavernicola]BEI81539.1 hypothetical protein CcaverHIS002_0206990 [Cutaneotrichosporon cavernicola]BEI89336.1 hypothetical protein CcaverHIS019_0206980 [Cutaneotrichosporon cavernicola]BEI97111.1 hypothetical protein CcaverHIS631_0207000 [Cutaneotrichosporon cavernicola]BEJ04884.1 hypothetical protein CcaverHIS641_0207010 [Cutaneotrichosporon cavernicola]